MGSRAGHVLQCVVRTFLAIVLVFSSVPLMPRQVIADDGISDEQIQSILSSGEYIDGEAVVIVRTHADIETSPQTEELAEVQADTVKQTVQDAAGAEVAASEEVALRAQSTQDETFEIKLVVDHGRSTEQLLRDLYADPDVISAEPNYTSTPAADTDLGLEETANNSGSANAKKPANEELANDDPKTNSGAANTELQEETPAGTPAASNAQTAEPALTAQSEPAQPTLSAQVDTTPRDLTGLQWGMDKSLSTPDLANTPISPSTGYSLNIPGWAEGRTNPNAPANASGTVCIMDTGFDATHPDLAGLLYKFTPEQQQKYGCGEYGYNASGDQLGTNYLRTSGDHGTHVTGIIAADWNDQGTSGVAHGIKIFCANVFGGRGRTMVLSDVLKGFQFLVDVSGETNLKAVNCSWGIQQPMYALTAMMNELGKKGVNTVIAAGNFHDNLDETVDVSSEAITSPYAIDVGSAMANGKSSEFSSYGQTTTHVFAPGSNVLSTVPELISFDVNTRDKTDKGTYARCTRYFPQATATENNLAYETFAGGLAGVRVFKENPATNAGAEEITSQTELVDTAGYGDRRSLAIPLSKMNKQASSTTFVNNLAVSGYAYLAIPISSAAAAKNVKWVHADMAMSDAFKPSGSLESVTCTKAEGGAPVEVDTAASSAIDTSVNGKFDTRDNQYKGWHSGASFTIYQTQWTPFSFNVAGLSGAYNAAHARIAAGEDVGMDGPTGRLKLQDLGVVGDVYAWQPTGATGQAYVIARVNVSHPTNDVKVADNTKLYVDNLALGNADAYTGAYITMPGTSMAAPAVTGCLAVIAKDEKPNTQLTGTELELEARERAAKLLASVEYDDENLGTLCRTGGRVNLAENPGFAKKAPLIYRAVSDGSTLTLTGCFFGTDGTLAIDDSTVATTSWSDGTITANVSDLDNGSHVAKVTTPDGVVMRVVFSQSNEGRTSESGTLPLYEETLATPVHAPGYEKEDRLYAPMVGCAGYIFAQTSKATSMAAQGFWRYDIANDTWTRHDLPDGYGVPSQPDKGNDLPTMCKGGMVAYRGSVYLTGDVTKSGTRSEGSALWRYDIEKDSWERIDIAMPSECALVVMNDDLLTVGGFYGEVFKGSNVRAAKVDLDNRKLTPIAGLEMLSGNQTQAVATSSKIYLHEIYDNAQTLKTTSRFLRLTYDKNAAKFTTEDLTSVFEAAGLLIESSKEVAAAKVHVGFAGLADGVALVGAAKKDDGSYVLGQDTHILYDDKTEVTEFDHTASYHRSYDPMATYYEGKLYAAAQCTAEPDAMYFRSTQIVKPATYAFVSGDGSSWTKSSTDPLTFTVKRSEADEQTYGRFVAVDVDGTAVDAENFETKAGSLILSLKPTYLQTLESQEHKLEVKFDDGTATATFTVTDAMTPGTNPGTNPGANPTNGNGGEQATDGGSDSSGTQGTTRTATGSTGSTGTTTLAKTADESISPLGFVLAALATLVVAACLRRRSV